MSHQHAIDKIIAQRQHNNIVAVLMAGGAGTRFWPVSTSEKPKQFLRLLGEDSLLQESYQRLKGIVNPDHVLVLTNQAFVPIVREQLPDIPTNQIIGEPYRRDTAAAVAYAALLAKRLFGDCTMCVLTSDHRISPSEVFQEVLLSALDGASHSTALYTLGIKPLFPATGYGYLHCGERLDCSDGPAHFKLLSFKEKPDLPTAEQFLASGDYFWNSGMFCWHIDSILMELQRQLPDHIKHLSKAAQAFGTAEAEQALALAFEPLTKVSIDFGVMEHALEVRMTEAAFQWFDVGNWLALEPFLQKDEFENYSRGKFYCCESNHNIVFTDDPDASISLVGCEDLIVVTSQRRTLVVPRSQLESVKKLVANLPPEMA